MASVIVLSLSTSHFDRDTEPASLNVGSAPASAALGVRLCDVYFKPIGTSDYAPVALHLFAAHQTRNSIIAFYQLWRCPNVSNYNGLNPLAEERGLLGDFDRAVTFAAAGHYAEGVNVLKPLIARADYFLEARLLLGMLRYASNDRMGALQTWKAALRAPYFPVPPDFPRPLPVQIGLHTLIRITEQRVSQ